MQSNIKNGDTICWSSGQPVQVQFCKLEEFARTVAVAAVEEDRQKRSKQRLLSKKADMKIKMSKPIKTVDERKKIASFITSIIDAGRLYTCAPYISDNDEFLWTVSNSNDWWVEFNKDDLSIFTIHHRYLNSKAISALKQWLAFKLDAELKNDE